MINKDKIVNLPSRVKIIGVPISAVNMDECIHFLMKNWNQLKGNYICVSNVHTTVMAHDNLKDREKIISDVTATEYKKWMAVYSGLFVTIVIGVVLLLFGFFLHN